MVLSSVSNSILHTFFDNHVQSVGEDDEDDNVSNEKIAQMHLFWQCTTINVITRFTSRDIHWAHLPAALVLYSAGRSCACRAAFCIGVL